MGTLFYFWNCITRAILPHRKGSVSSLLGSFFFLQSNLKDTLLNVTLAKHRGVTILGEEDRELALAY